MTAWHDTPGPLADRQEAHALSTGTVEAFYPDWDGGDAPAPVAAEGRTAGSSPARRHSEGLARVIEEQEATLARIGGELRTLRARREREERWLSFRCDRRGDGIVVTLEGQA